MRNLAIFVKFIYVSGVSGSGPTSEFVRQELRAVVGARTGQQPQQQPSSRPPSQLLNQQQVDLEALGLSFEMPNSGELVFLNVVYNCLNLKKK